MKDFFSRAKSMMIIIFVVVFVVLSISYVYAQNVTPTSCVDENGIPKPFNECLGGNVDKKVFPISGYQEYFDSNGATTDAFNRTVRRIIFDIIFIASSGLTIGFISVSVWGTIERVLGADNEEKVKKAKKRINSALFAIIIVVIFMFIAQVTSVIVGAGNIWNLKLL